MALPNGAGGYQVGAGNRAETLMSAMAAPQTATTTATLTAAQVVSQMLVANPGSGAAATYTLPTAALIDAAVPNATVGSTFDLALVNIGTSSGTATLATATGITDGGNAFTVVAVTSSALFRFRKTGDAAYTVYKVA
jgi:hypothetical protein